MFITAIGTTILSICGGIIVIDYWYAKGKKLIDYQNRGPEPVKKGTKLKRVK